ncbi:hypothetical protein, partial [Klebsiella pneumoniae]|uniref:hypothetical protein n=1 Tax=Klebsiella pneumoniae TaxID=573 RepID=UPI001CEC9C23
REKKLKALAEQPYDDRAYAMSVHRYGRCRKTNCTRCRLSSLPSEYAATCISSIWGWRGNPVPLIITDFLPL